MIGGPSSVAALYERRIPVRSAVIDRRYNKFKYARSVRSLPATERLQNLQKSEHAQIFAGLIKATAAERRYELPSILQSGGIDFPIAPREKFVSEGKRTRLFVFQHEHCLLRVPFVFRCQDGSTKHVKKAVHFRLHFVAMLPERMMQASGELDRDLVCRRRNQCLRDLHRG